MKNYRTLEQFETILDSRYNGNIGECAKYMVQYGFWAGDIKEMFVHHQEHFEWFNPIDLFTAIELATEIREKSE